MRKGKGENRSIKKSQWECKRGSQEKRRKRGEGKEREKMRLQTGA